MPRHRQRTPLGCESGLTESAHQPPVIRGRAETRAHPGLPAPPGGKGRTHDQRRTRRLYQLQNADHTTVTPSNVVFRRRPL